jgi:hypothetical protein
MTATGISYQFKFPLAPHHGRGLVKTAVYSVVSVAKSQIVILSEAKDLENHRDSSLRSE